MDACVRGSRLHSIALSGGFLGPALGAIAVAGMAAYWGGGLRSLSWAFLASSGWPATFYGSIARSRVTVGFPRRSATRF